MYCLSYVLIFPYFSYWFLLFLLNAAVLVRCCKSGLQEFFIKISLVFLIILLILPSILQTSDKEKQSAAQTAANKR